jgi:hypothetical protein
MLDGVSTQHPEQVALWIEDIADAREPSHQGHDADR